MWTEAKKTHKQLMEQSDSESSELAEVNSETNVMLSEAVSQKLYHMQDKIRFALGHVFRDTEPEKKAQVLNTAKQNGTSLITVADEATPSYGLIDQIIKEVRYSDKPTV